MLIRSGAAVGLLLLLPWCSSPAEERDVPPVATSSPAPRRAPASGGEPRELAGITRAHNEVRKRVGVASLAWDDSLAATAAAWARRCVDRKAPRGMLDHNPERSAAHDEYVGENLMASTAPVAAREAVDAWAAEGADYDRERNRCRRGKVCGHYTQLVWSDTERVGCAASVCPRLDFPYVVVCNYGPGGNRNGAPPY